MADDKIVVSAIARVTDLATGPLKGIAKAITGVSEVAKKTSGALSTVGGAVSGLGNRLGAATSRVGGFVRGMGAMLGPVSALASMAGIGGLTVGLTRFIDKTKALQAASLRLGLTTDTLQTMFEVFGTAERGESAMDQLQKTMIKIRQGGKEIQPTIDLLRRMGETMEMIKAGNYEAMMPIIMESFARTTDETTRGAMATALLGKNWQEFLPHLIKGRKGYADAKKSADKFRISQEGVNKGVEAGSALKDLGDIAESAGNKIAEALLPTFTALVKILGDFIDRNRELLGQWALPVLIGAIATAVIGLGAGVVAALGWWTLLVGAIVGAGTAIYQNWDKIIKWVDDKVPGLSTTIAKAGTDVANFVKKAAADISKGFEEGGLAGGVEAYVNTFKAAWSGIGGWFEEQFRKINWDAVGTWAGGQLHAAMVGVIKIEQALAASVEQQMRNALASLRASDPSKDGENFGFRFMTGFLQGVREFDAWWQGLADKLNASLKTVDWGAMVKKFFQLDAELSAMAEQWVKGMIIGMLKAVPGFKEVADAIKATVAFGERQFGPGPQADAKGNYMLPGYVPPVTPSGPMSPMPGTPTADLLALARQGGSKSEVTIKNIVTLPNGGTVTTESSQSGAPLNVEVGRSQTVMP